ncbi:MAG TPA: RNA polymerase sigma factor [Acidobacteriaceae bacterium]|nr:RNA polymerase sigma factor [Acidobacteriaceae bacterium]
MAFRPSPPEPEDPGEMKDFRDQEEAGEGFGLPGEPGEGPEPRSQEDWDAEAGEDGELEEVENQEDSPQLTDPNGVSRDMATAALNSGVLQGRPASGDTRTVGGPADWRAVSDAEIMLRVREGDDTGFSFLIEKYRKPIINFMYRMVHNQAVAEELAQEVFLRVYRSRLTYRAEAKFTTWLYRIATNLGVNHARDTKYERSAQTVYLDQPDAETGTTPDVADDRPLAEDELVKDERMRAIRKHVMALPERQRTAVLMHKYQGLDYKEIGAVLKLSESATKSLLFRAYQTLRERLKEFVQD